MKFIRLYNIDKTSVVEIFPDEYVHWQPKNMSEIDEKLSQFSNVTKRLRDVCLVIVDCDKAIQYDKLNYVLLEELISHVDKNIAVIFKNCNDTLKKIVNSMKISKNIKVYFNDIHRV